MTKVVFLDKNKNGVNPLNIFRDSDANELKASINAAYDKMVKSYISAYDFTSGATTTTVAQNTYAPLIWTPIVGMKTSDWTITGTTAIYSGTITKIFKIDFSIISTSGNNNEIRAAIFHNNTEEPETEGAMTIGAVGRYEQLIGFGLIEVEAGDIIDIRVKNRTATGDVIISRVHLLIDQLVLPQ